MKKLLLAVMALAASTAFAGVQPIAFNPAFQGHGPVVVESEAIELDSQGSKIVAEGETCTYHPAKIESGSLLSQAVSKTPARIECGDKTYAEGEFEMKSGSPTGTPPHLEFADTYIGSYVKAAGDKPGAGERFIFLVKK